MTASAMGTAMQLAPPFHFDGVTVRLFPLRASRQHLQRFIDQYLNIVPPQVARFRVPVPFVYLMLINYGRMAVDAANLGWVSQREIAFCVPLEWYELRNGRYEFRDWATICPFIYVDNPLSMTTGREVYGWPKSIARLDEELNAWMENPLAKPRLAKVSAMLFPSAYQGQRQEPRVFLEVIHGPAPQALRVPLSRENPALPWNILPNVIHSALGLGGDALGILTGMGVLQRQPGLDRGDYLAMAKRAGKMLRPRDLNLVANTVNLKQFRASDSPAHVCYQALTNAPMAITRYNQGGMLGDANLLLGDTSGGYSVLLHRYASTPVIESLGLEVEHEWRGADAPVARLRPVLPCWYEVDMRYDRPETLAWRTRDSAGWVVGTGSTSKAWSRSLDDEAPTPNRFNTVTGAASQEVAGPFDFPDSTLRVLPLLADPAKLRELCQSMFNEPLREAGMRFEPWGDYVYMIVGSHNGVSSDTNNIGWWADRDVSFFVPMKWYVFEGGAPTGEADRAPYRNHPGARLHQAVLVPVFAYANSTTAAISMSEVSGAPMMQAAIVCPDGPWLESSGPSEAITRRLMDLSTTVLPVLGEGQGAEVRRLIEITDGLVAPRGDDETWRRISEGWGETLRREVNDAWKRRSAAGPLFDATLSIALSRAEVSATTTTLTLKQFRDGENPDLACFQALVALRRELKRVHDAREIEAKLTVRIHDYPTQPIVQTLGLVPKHVSYEGGARVYCLEPVRPFWLRTSLRDHLGETVQYRAGSEVWQPNPAHKPTPGLAQSRDKMRADLANRVFPRRLSAQVAGLLPLGVPPMNLRGGADLSGLADLPQIDASVASAALELFDLQMFLGAALSREWENWSDETRWSAALAELRASLRAATQDVAPVEHDERLLQFLTARVDQLDEREGLPGGEKLVGRREQRRFLLNALRDESTRLSVLGVAWPAALLGQFARLASDDLLYVAARRALSRLGPAVRDEPRHRALKKVFLPLREALMDFQRAALADLAEGCAVRAPAELEPVLARLRPAAADPADAPDDERPRLLASVCERIDWLITTVRDLPEEMHARVQPIIIQDTREEFTRNLEQLLCNLALAAQKPDHCALADNLPDPERSYVFPADQAVTSNGMRWYVGAPTTPQKTAAYRLRDRIVARGGPVTAEFSDEASARGMGAIRTVAVWQGEVVDALQVTCEFGAMPKHGGGGGRRREVEFGPHERLVRVRFTVAPWFGALHLYDLTFVSLDRRTGALREQSLPAGVPVPIDAQRYEIAVQNPASNDDEIGALHGGTWLHTDGTEALSRLGGVVISKALPDEIVTRALAGLTP
ncbi:MAG: acetoacetate decarboxylase family protein [Polyangiales bacterium]